MKGKSYCHINFFKSALDQPLFNYGVDYCEFVGSDYLVMNNKDTQSGQRKTVVVSLSQKKAYKYASELPREIRQIMPQRIVVPADKRFTVNTRSLVADAKGMAITMGGKFAEKPRQFKYWASATVGNNRPVSYSAHSWTPVASTCSLEAGLAASADQLGEIHVWSLSSGRRVHVLKPINHGLYHVEWFPDETGVYLGTRFLKRADKVAFDFNQYGPITSSFSFDDWQLKQVSDRKATYKTVADWKSSNSSETFSLTNRGARDLVLKSSFGTFDNLFDQMRNGSESQKLKLKKWGNPTCFVVHQLEDGGPMPDVVVGTANGFLLQFEIVKKSGKHSLKLRRQFSSHEAKITSLSISPIRKLLASVSLDGTVRVWKMGAARTLADVDFVTDGTRIIELAEDSRSEGLEIGDSVREFDGKPYYERIQKIQSGYYRPGQTVKVRVIRTEKNGQSEAVEKSLEFDIRLVEADDIEEPIMNLFLTRKDNWIAWNRKGYYNSSPQGAKHVGWHVNRGREKSAEFTQVSQFSQLCRPDIVGAVAANWSEEAVAEVSRPLDDDEVSILEMVPDTIEKYEKIRPPQIYIAQPHGDLKTRKSSIQVEFSLATPNHLPINRLQVFNNGHEISARPKELDSSRSDGLLTTRHEIEVPLKRGRNEIAILARHAAATSNQATVSVFRAGEKQSSTASSKVPDNKLYVLAVGVSEYESDDFTDLDFADDDARDFAATWKKQEGKMYRKVITKVIVDKEATQEGVEEGFDWLIEQPLRANDTVFVFMSGHAMFDEKDIWVFGSNDVNAKKLARTGIKYLDLNALLEIQLREAGTVIAFLDTCHAGSVKANSLGVPKYLPHHSQGLDVWMTCQKRVIASCTQKETSIENKDWKNGAFTEGLIEALQRKDTDVNADGFIDVEELALKTRVIVEKKTKSHQSPVQTGQTLNSRAPKIAKSVEN